MKQKVSYCAFVFLLLVVNQPWLDGADAAVPNFKNIYINITANTSALTPTNELVSVVDIQALFQFADFTKAMADIGVKRLNVPLTFSTLKLKDGVSTGFNMTEMLINIAEVNPQSTKPSDILQIVKNSFQLDKRGSNIDYAVIESNQEIMMILKASGIPFEFLTMVIDVGKVMNSLDVKKIAITSMSSDKSFNDIVLDNVDYNILVDQIKIENVVKNEMIAGFLKGYGVSDDLLKILSNLDSSKLIKALDFNKIVNNVMKLRNGENTEADITAYIKAILSGINTKDLADLMNLNDFIDALLDQNQIEEYLTKLGLPKDIVKAIADSININAFLKNMDIGKLLMYNGTSLTGFYKYILDKIDLNEIVPNFNFEKLLQIPKIETLLNQTKIDPDLVKIIIESVDINAFFKSFDVPRLIMDLRTNKDKDYIKVLLNNTDIDGVLESIDIDKLFSHQKVTDFVRANFQIDPLLAKLFLKNFKVGDFLKEVDTKKWSKLLVESVNGTAQAVLEKVLDLVTIDSLLQNVDFKKFLENSKVQEIMERYGIDPIILEVVSSLGINDLIKSVKFDEIIKDAIKSGNFDINEILQKIMAQVDMTNIFKKIDWKKLIEGATTGKLTLPVSPECAIELGKFVMASNSSTSFLENPAFKSK